ncbi:RES family NAD+ phosphorylase [Cerasicoccus fimbriatus]|uniref:RES family NAD+ phosphorylase n=1 Tax=Cerasicoccus fimbriatus TaxID=3014554 RepID=UPI0022B2D8D6|nr:RES family NAD+ phosphorylase [Cerasicoccus sp. TK19100]
MNTNLAALISGVNINDYVMPIEVTGNWVSYRYTGSPLTASKKEGRYNEDGVNAFYLADSQETAAHEVRHNFNEKDLYRVKPGTIYVFDAYKFATDNCLNHPLTGSPEDGSYKFCQDIAYCLTMDHGLSGVRYPSRQMALKSKSGQCIVLLPQEHQLVNGELRIFQ